MGIALSNLFSKSANPRGTLLAHAVKIGMTAALMTFLLPIAAHAQNRVGAVGGGGGGEFQIMCEPGDQLVGIDTWATHVIDFIAPVCGNRRNDPLATYGRPSVGTPQVGTLHQPRCPPAAVLTILHVISDGPLVSRVGFTCWNIVNNAMTDSFPDYGGANVVERRLVCPVGEVGVGIYGRAGTAIDYLGLICGPWQVAAAPSVITPPFVVEPPPVVVPPPPPGAVTVQLATDRYTLPHGQGVFIDILQAGTPGVMLVEPCQQDWCHVSYPGKQGWVFNYTDARSGVTALRF